MKRIRLLIWLFLLASSIAFGQTVQISGTVTSSEDGSPIPGVTVLVKGTTLGTATSVDGKYSLSAPTSATILQFSFVGYKTQEVPIGGRTKVDVTLAADVISVDEVVVVAYGTAKKASFTGASAMIDGKKLEARPVTNITKAIEGTNPGIQVTSASGQPGASQDIRIRGYGSISASNSPLYVVDGVQYSGNIGNLNSQDIESISVLKDAASTALYGNKAANGVVMITTKKGIKDRSTITINATQGFSTRSIPEYSRVSALEYYPLMWESNRNSQLTFPVTTDPNLPSAAAIAAANQKSKTNLKTIVGYNILNVPDTMIVDLNGQINPNAQFLGTYGEDLDWQKEIMRKGNRKEYGLTYNGGSDRNDYFVSLGYLDEKGYTIKSDYQRFTGRINVNSQAKKWLKTGLNLSANVTNSNVASSGGTNYVNPFFFTRNMGPIYPVYAHDPLTGEYLSDPATGGKVYDLGNIPGLPTRVAGASPGRHVVAETMWNDNLFRRNVLGARTFVDINFLKDFKFTVNFGYDITAYNGSSYTNKIVGDGAPAGRGTRTNSLTTSYTINQLLNYNKTFGKHTIGVLLGHENYDYTYNYFYGFRQGQIADGNTELINFTTTNSLTSYTDKYRTEGLFSRLDYNYNSRYVFSASIRKDGSSRFASDNRWGTFWSVSGAWRLDQENFVKNISSINYLKLRTSYGAVGNDAGIGYYAYQALYDLGINNAAEPGFLQASRSNNSLSWESNNQFDVAVEFTIFKRITGSAEFYHRITSDLLFDVPLPASSGLTSYQMNIGSMYNQGLEFTIGADIISKSDFKWNFNINLSTIKNEITKLPEGQTEIIQGTKKLMVGHSMYDFWLRDWYGVDPADGGALFDANIKDPVSQASNVRIIGNDTVSISQNNAKYHYAGTSIPDLMGGFTNTLSYKGFDLSFMATYQVGGLIYDGAYAAIMHPGTYGAALSSDILNRWQKPGDITNVPRLDFRQPSVYGAQSDRFLTDASFIALKNVTFAYNLPSAFARKLQVQSARIYFSGENLWLKNARKGMDPQYSFGGTTDNVYSPSRIITIGLNVTL
jgi:TonB-linked SusC/RagA family outer membrane protein